MTVSPELEAMSRAMAQAMHQDPDNWQRFEPLARAALLAIRHPSTAAWDAGSAAMIAATGADDGLGAGFSAMIDHILGEPK